MAIYMNYNNLAIKGNVTAAGYENWIDITHFNFDIKRAISMETGNASNREGTRPKIDAIKLTKNLDCASGGLFKDSLVGVEGVKVIIDVVKTGASAVEKYSRITLEDCLVSSYNLQASGGAAPTEALELSFTKILTDMTGADRGNKNGSNMLVGDDLANAKPL
jgi:type VI secretion system secreted protein Hcp